MRNEVKLIESLQKENELLKQGKAQLETKLTEFELKFTELELKLKWFKDQRRLHLNKLFGRSSEKISPGQLSLFNECFWRKWVLNKFS